jgi:hypothetical protein
MMTITGAVQSLHILPNRPDLVVLVVGGKDGGTFNASIKDVTCGSVAPRKLSDIAVWLAWREANATVTFANADQRGIGVIEADRIALTSDVG